MFVKLPGAFVEGMHPQRPDAGILGNAHCAANSVLKQGPSKLDTLGSLVYSQPGQHRAAMA